MNDSVVPLSPRLEVGVGDKSAWIQFIFPCSSWTLWTSVCSCSLASLHPSFPVACWNFVVYRCVINQTVHLDPSHSFHNGAWPNSWSKAPSSTAPPCFCFLTWVANTHGGEMAEKRLRNACCQRTRAWVQIPNTLAKSWGWRYSPCDFGAGRNETGVSLWLADQTLSESVSSNFIEKTCPQK